MPRQPRPQVPGGIYHITSRGNRRAEIVIDDTDRARLLLLVARVVARCDWRCHAYCLMDNHYHLVVETPQPNISDGMHELNLGYAKWFNRRYALDGHLFQNRFFARLAASDWHFLELSRYVVLNPVRAGLCDDPADWRWSSYRAMVGRSPAPRFLTVERVLSFFGKDRKAARNGYIRFVREGLLHRRH